MIGCFYARAFDEEEPGHLPEEPVIDRNQLKQAIIKAYYDGRGDQQVQSFDALFQH